MCLLPHRADNLINFFPSNFFDIHRIAIILYACDCDDMRNTFPPSDIEKCAFWEKSYVYWRMNHAWIHTKPEIDELIQPTVPRDLGNKTCLPSRRADNLTLFPSNFLDIYRIAIILYVYDYDDIRNTFPSLDMQKCTFWEK